MEAQWCVWFADVISCKSDNCKLSSGMVKWPEQVKINSNLGLLILQHILSPINWGEQHKPAIILAPLRISAMKWRKGVLHKLTLHALIEDVHVPYLEDRQTDISGSQDFRECVHSSISKILIKGNSSDPLPPLYTESQEILIMFLVHIHLHDIGRHSIVHQGRITSLIWLIRWLTYQIL